MASVAPRRLSTPHASMPHGAAHRTHAGSSRRGSAPALLPEAQPRPARAGRSSNRPRHTCRPGIQDADGNTASTPGQLLYSLNFGPVPDDPTMVAQFTNRKPMIDVENHNFNRDFRKYQLRCHIYQARGLHPASYDGLSNPWVEAKLRGETAVLWEQNNTEWLNDEDNFLKGQPGTDVKKQELNPMWWVQRSAP